MRNYLDEIIVGVILISAFVFALIGLKGSLDKTNEDWKKQDQEHKKFIDDCIVKGGRVENIGSTFTKNYIVCNPK